MHEQLLRFPRYSNAALVSCLLLPGELPGRAYDKQFGPTHSSRKYHFVLGYHIPAEILAA